MELEELVLQVGDLRREVESLSVRLHQGKAPHRYDPDRLRSLYIEAHKDSKIEPATLWKLWSHLIWTLDAHQLLTLARTTGDPFPWRPFFFVMLRSQAAGVDTGREWAYLETLAQDLLTAQGMSKVQPRDLLGARFPIRSSLQTIREWKEVVRLEAKEKRLRRRSNPSTGGT